jgi:GntR family transcriptional regulator of arabinose operon
MDINARLPTPIPQQLKLIIIEKIRRGQYIPGEKMPSERELAETYGISRISVREAVTELVAENYLFRIPTKGTFVAMADQVARKLRLRSFSVAFVINKAWYAFALPGYTRILEGVERALRKRGYRLLFMTSDPGEELNLELSRGSDAAYSGFLLVGPTSSVVVEKLKAVQAPFIMLDAEVTDEDVNTVAMDYFGGARQAIKYLARLGHQDIGYIGVEHSDKYRGHVAALHQLGLPVRAEHTEFVAIHGDGRPGYEHGYDAVTRILQRGTLPTALHITNDIVALGAMEALRKRGVEIPRDISILGYDDIDLSRRADPPLTTVCADLEEFGAIGAQRLFSLMEDPEQIGQRLSVRLDLVIRGSTGRPRGDEAVPTGETPLSEARSES